MPEIQRASKRELFGWAMFDFANSSYTTVIITVVFCIIFPRLIVGDGPEFRLGNLLWSLALSVSYLIVLVSSPLIGAAMDYTGSKKRFLFGSFILTVMATASLFFVGPGDIIAGMVLVILSNVGFSYSEAFVSSFLPGLGPPQDLGKISGFAWGLGYFGGLISTSIVIFGFHGGVYTLNNFVNLRMVGPVTGLFFLVTAIPTFLWVRDRTAHRAIPPGETFFSIGIKRIRNTFLSMSDYRDLIILLSSFFFAYAGLSIVISFAFIYGDQIVKWSRGTQTLMFVVTQITAAAGAFLFGFIQDEWGAKKSYLLTLAIWFIAVILIYAVNDLTVFINHQINGSLSTEHVFLAVGSIAGLALGSTQSACRAMVGLFSPDTKAGEFFGLWSFTSRLSAIMGLMGLGLLQALLGLKIAVLVCSLFFLAAIVIVLFVDEERGKRAARKHAGE